ncbi:acetate--CoA ligase family protein [Mesorhizobium sp. BH1-1-5]|uniref:acetate--CoA ligase family protein n=1 Tax=Mesorhizobium sp. BH1-1-5 TaxID=2876661 RepID=UPI001CC958E9|nr:acetate--CoA ligase family protein [Mesorhizobium sp. BH1-1-5]MBZ9991348.1 acetate--CoA ligase family protein [Mesorhizobium sp. BH1-1-5]
MTVSKLLRPQTLAIVGASPKPESFGANLLQSIRYLGFPGQVYLVNPRYDQIDDQPCYPDVASIPGGVDCAALAVGDALLVDSFASVAEAGVGGAVLFSRAYGQTPDGRTRGKAIADVAVKAGMAVCGANCMGFVNLVDRLQVTGMPFRSLPAPSGVALISHSGSTWSGLVGNRRQMGFDYAISAGQELVTTVADYIRFLLEETDARVIACVLETVRDPEGFLAAARLAEAKGVPIVALKLGRSEAGRHFAISHSGALSGSNEAYEAAFARYRVIQVRTLDELLDTVELLELTRPMMAPGVALGTDSGGERQLISDLAADVGLSFAPLAPATRAAVEAYLDPGMEASNPLDYWGDGADVMAPVLSEMAKDPDVGIVVMATNLPPDRNFSELSAAAIRKVHARTDKPVAVMGNIATTLSPVIAEDLRERGIAVLMGTGSGLAALRHLQSYRFGRHGSEDVVAIPLSADAAAIVDAAPLDSLRSADGFRLLELAGIPVTPFADIHSPQDIAAFAGKHGWPIALKIDDAAIPHKSDLGGVVLNLKGADEALAAYQALHSRHPAAPILAQTMASGVELILGMTTDPDFGPIVTLGLGGVFAEVLRDVATLIPPFGVAEARRALEGLRGHALLTGARGRGPVDMGALCTLVSRFSAMAVGAKERIVEIEINPIMAGPNEAVAVDCLTLRHRKARHDVR